MKALSEAVNHFKDKNVLVIGDLMLDQYTHGEVKRISPEAPIPVLTKTEEKFVPGGAANVAYNLAAMEAKVCLAGVVGNDGNREKLLNLLDDATVNTEMVLAVPNRPTTLKRRFVTNGNQQLIRLDEEVVTPLTSKQEDSLIKMISGKITDFDGVVLSDYTKGVFSGDLAKKIIDLAHEHNLPVIGDIKPQNKSRFKGIDIITPNLKEALEMTGEPELENAGKKLVEYFCSNVLITKGAEGMSVFSKKGSRNDIPTKKVKVYDVSGAGDTAVAALTLGLLCGLSLKNAAVVSNAAAGVVIQKPGTSTLTAEEIKASLDIKHHIDGVEIVPKVWGYEKWIVNTDKYCTKLLFLKKGYQCSHHYHKEKDEVFLVSSGHVRLELGKKGKKVIHMREGDFHRVLPNTVHSFRGIEDAEILEVSTHHDDRDSYRLDKSKKVS